ncbi:serine carboxypeptidase-like clade I [Marchantia polymorpha subsp. ruderalis]|uniref:Carboxypeptidase n=2 Tax=Marchantia polymorpha TaxID=3197 RepID=A0AAF6AQZ9_MARPO|nr:hypothetical protein MARPO_0001s0023 [Marchantia polymorpha]BBM98869.1 hypothetical protein Mp_1g16820 [Marchantia polymorpha subsp. ruderalis]|eukprot:PTQ49946.1 hypothetical protein MARPO_0001s0023 [Marchantia polymorpha]
MSPRSVTILSDTPAGLGDIDHTERATIKMGDGIWKGMRAAAGALMVIGLLQGCLGLPEEALITHVPGFEGEFPSAHYGGYVSVDESHGRQLYYYFVTSESSTARTDPLVVWLNGGPGCSSFDGFIYEHGPFEFEPAKGEKDLPKLTENRYSWSKVANILYVDSPAGVGFSYSKTKADYLTGELKTASDLHKFLLKWIELYPEYKTNSLFVTGESYGGIYVPTLSRNIAEGIEAGVEPVLNFKGYAIGNGCTDQAFDGNAIVPFVHGMGLISDELFEATQKACAGNYWNITTEECEKHLETIDEDVKDINVYDILEPCYHKPKTLELSVRHSRLPSSFRKLGETQRKLNVRKRMFGRAWPLRLPNIAGRVPTWGELGDEELEVPCMDDHVAMAWLNNPAVREALHAAPMKEIGLWELCTNQIIFYSDAGSMIPIHRNLTLKGYRALVYSGDHDMCVPYTGSEAWTRSMGYKVVDRWRPWFVDGQVAGYTQGYANHLTFATVKGSGHTVPEYKPAEALTFLRRWLADEPL